MTRAWWHDFSRRIPIPGAVAAGVGLAGLAALAEVAGRNPGFGRVQLLVVLAGGALVAVGLLGKRAARIYLGSAVLLLNTLLLLVVAEVGASVVLNARTTPAPAAAVVATASYYDDQPWAATLERETGESRRRVRYEPYVLWQREAYAGETVTIDSGGARVTPGQDCRPGAYTVLVFGGSTVWGVGAPDWATIPAFLQSALTRRLSQPVCVRNFGEPGFVSTHEVIKLLQVLRAGVEPDLVLFYDGINESIAALEGGPGAHYGLQTMRERFEWSPERRLLARSHLARLAGLVKVRTGADRAAAPDLATAVVETYLTNARVVAGLATEFSFAFAFFWQPVLTVDRNPTTAEEERFRASVPSDLAALYERTYDLVEAAAAEVPRLHYLGAVFQDEPQQVYADFGHLLPPGNAAVAEAMLARLPLPPLTGPGGHAP